MHKCQDRFYGDFDIVFPVSVESDAGIGNPAMNIPISDFVGFSATVAFPFQLRLIHVLSALGIHSQRRLYVAKSPCVHPCLHIYNPFLFHNNYATDTHIPEFFFKFLPRVVYYLNV